MTADASQATYTPIADFVEATGAARCDLGPRGSVLVQPGGVTTLFLAPDEDGKPWTIVNLSPLTARVLSSFLQKELFPGCQDDKVKS